MTAALRSTAVEIQAILAVHRKNIPVDLSWIDVKM